MMADAEINGLKHRIPVYMCVRLMPHVLRPDLHSLPVCEACNDLLNWKAEIRSSSRDSCLKVSEHQAIHPPPQQFVMPAMDECSHPSSRLSERHSHQAAFPSAGFHSLSQDVALLSFGTQLLRFLGISVSEMIRPVEGMLMLEAEEKGEEEEDAF
jgi:hypothetical protein